MARSCSRLNGSISWVVSGRVRLAPRNTALPSPQTGDSKPASRWMRAIALARLAAVVIFLPAASTDVM